MIPETAKRSCHPAVPALCARIDRLKPDWLAQHPPEIAARLDDRWRRTYSEKGLTAAGRELRETTEAANYQLPPNAGEEKCRSRSKKLATFCAARMDRHGAELESKYAAGSSFVKSFGLEPPKLKPGGELPAIKRMACKRWWRKRLAVHHEREQERLQRELGMVCHQESLYLSSSAFMRGLQRDIGGQLFVDSSGLICDETGEYLSMRQVYDSGQSNPANRRREMMLRVKASEAWADSHFHAGVFSTITAASDSHAIRKRDGARLPGGKLSPKAVHADLCSRWRLLTQACRDRDIPFYGLRVVEPHHDGTPHWHVLWWSRTEQRSKVCALVQQYMLEPSPTPARLRQGVKHEFIQSGKGKSATGYIAKYIAKNVDGHSLDSVTTVDETGEQTALRVDPANHALRVRYWASLWGIRQFQTFGLPSIGVYRELRRLGKIAASTEAEELRAAADAGDMAQYVKLMGGPSVTRGDWPASIVPVETGRLGEYGEMTYKPSLRAYGIDIESRPLTWRIEYAPKPEALPATSNGTSVDIALTGPASLVDCKGFTKPSDLGAEARISTGRNLPFYSPWLAAQRRGEAASPWTCGNNCRPLPVRGP